VPGIGKFSTRMNAFARDFHKFGIERKVAILHCNENKIRPEFLSL
jgi:hypothetical protein